MQKQAGSIIDEGKESLAPETLGDCSALSSKGNFSLFVCFVCFCGRLLSKELGIPIGILPTSRAVVDGNAPYQAQELQITTLANPGIQTNFLPPRLVQS